MASAGYPQPPDVVRPQQAPQPDTSVFSPQPGGNPQQAGQNPGAEALQQIKGGLQELDGVVSKLKTMLDQYDKSLSVFLQPMAQAGLELGKALEEKAQRSGMAGGSPVIPPQGAVAPGGRPSPQGV